MRLRLRIERNALPPTQALWPIQNPKATIAQLLHFINEIFPLEADTWGLEDYSVSVGGYECLHYHEIRAVCRDEDEVVIQPLGWRDLKVRRVTGRMQIAGDGRHLVDGVPYGRPAVRAPVRPEVVIPPRKRRKLGSEEEGEEPVEERLLLTERREGLEEEEDDDEEDEEDDEDFEGSSSEEEVSVEEESDDTDEEASSSEDDSSDTSDSDSEDAESWNGLSNSELPTSLKPALRSQATTAAGELETPPQGAKRKRTSNDELEVNSKQNHTMDDSEPTGLPFEGKLATRSRNARRRDAKRLKYLKEQKGFPAGATIADMKQWAPKGSLEAGTNTVNAEDLLMPDVASIGAEEASSDSAPSVEGIADRKEQVAEVSKAESRKKRKVNDAPAAASNVEDSDFESRRQKLLSAIQSGGVDIDDTSMKPVPEESAVTSQSLPTTAPRARLNLASSQRLVFGSLGVRVPKTQQERDALQKKLADRSKRNVNLEHVDRPQTNGEINAAETSAVSDDTESEAWRAKIHLTAVECCDEGVTLSTPPFPFHQRWDPQQKRKAKKSKAKSATYMADTSSVGKKRKRGQTDQQQEYFETYDKYNTNGNGDALDYDGEEGDEDDEYWEDGALLNGEDDDAGDEEESDDGFPDLPSDIDSLPLLEAHEAKIDDFITFAELACDESTEWQPKTAIRTARILSVPATDGDQSGEFTLLLSKRDRLPKVFDEEGNRIYSKFEMPGMDEEEEEDGNEEQEGTRRVEWHELGPVKLISRRGAGW